MSNLPYFQRAWRVTVDTAAGDHLVVSSSDSSPALRVVFEVNTYMMMAYWMANLSVYNMARSSSDTISGVRNIDRFWAFNQPLITGDYVQISAGYQYDAAGNQFNPDANILYTGRLLQAVYTREMVVDTVLRLRCAVGLFENTINFVNFPWISGASALNTLQAICSFSHIPLLIDERTSALLASKTYPRGQAVFGRPFQLIDDIVKQAKLDGAAQNLMPIAWQSPLGFHLRSFAPDDSALAFTPDHIFGAKLDPSQQRSTTTPEGAVKRTVLGVPELTWDGIRFRVLMDGTVQLGQTVQLTADTLVNLAPVEIGSYPSVTTPTGRFIVSAVHHVADSRGHGDDWYTEITGLARDFFANSILSIRKTQ